MKKHKTQNLKTNHKSINTKLLLALAVIPMAACILPEVVVAGPSPDAFDNALTKIAGWTNGSAGKLITFISLVGAAIMGVLGFSGRAIMGAIGIGVLLSAAKAIVDMIF
jgi:hypothetical protein